MTMEIHLDGILQKQSPTSSHHLSQIEHFLLWSREKFGDFARNNFSIIVLLKSTALAILTMLLTNGSHLTCLALFEIYSSICLHLWKKHYLKTYKNILD